MQSLAMGMLCNNLYHTGFCSRAWMHIPSMMLSWIEFGVALAAAHSSFGNMAT